MQKIKIKKKKALLLNSKALFKSSNLNIDKRHLSLRSGNSPPPRSEASLRENGHLYSPKFLIFSFLLYPPFCSSFHQQYHLQSGILWERSNLFTIRLLTHTATHIRIKQLNLFKGNNSIKQSVPPIQRELQLSYHVNKCQ